MMNVLGKVRFEPEVCRSKIIYHLQWEGVAFCPVKSIFPGEDVHVPSLNLDLPLPEGGFFSASETWSSPEDSLFSYWEIIKRSSIRCGEKAILAKNHCWVMSLAGEWIDISMHVRPEGFREGKVEVLEPMEWDDDMEDEGVVEDVPFEAGVDWQSPSRSVTEW